MNIEDVLGRLFAHHDILAASKGASRREPSMTDVLWSGWDFYPASPEQRWRPAYGGPADNVRWGMARLPHLAAAGLAPAPTDLDLTFAPGTMTAFDLFEAFWFVLGIDPLEPKSRNLLYWLMASKTPDREAISKAKDAIVKAYRVCLGDDHVQTIIGVRITDIVDSIVALQTSVPDLAALLRSKQFAKATKLPTKALAWSGVEVDKKRYLPLLIAHAALAELSRLGQNFGAFLHLLFDSAGNPYQLTNLLNQTGGSSDLARRLLISASLQSVGAVDPDGNNPSADSMVAQLMRRDININPNTGEIEIDPRPLEDVAQQPRHAEQGRLRKNVLPAIPAVSIGGLEWRDFVNVALYEIYSDTRKMAKAVKWSPGFPVRDRDISQLTYGQAATWLMLSWVQFHHPRAYPVVILPNMTAAGLTGRPSPDQLSDSLTIGSKLQQKARSIMASRPSPLPLPGKLGYTARYKLHLWLDNKGDDCEAYRKTWQGAPEIQSETLKKVEAYERRQHAHILSIPSNVGCGAKGVKTIKQHGQQPAPLASNDLDLELLAARDAAMMTIGPATDPIRTKKR